MTTRTQTRLGTLVAVAVRQARGVALESVIIDALRKKRGNVSAAARDLGVQRTYLYKLIKTSSKATEALRRIRKGGTK